MGTEGEATNSIVARIEKCCSSCSITPGFIKLLCGFTAASFFGVGIRSAWKQTRGADREHLTRVKVISGVGFASRALGTATLLSVSGFSIFIIGVSALLNVNTPKQFGDRMKAAFGDSLRIPKKNPDDTSITSLTELFEQAAAQSKPPVAESAE